MNATVLAEIGLLCSEPFSVLLDRCINEVDKCDRAVMMECKTELAQRILMALLEAYRLHKLYPDELPELPPIALFPASAHSNSDSDSDSQSDALRLLPLQRKRKHRSTSKRKPSEDRCSSKTRAAEYLDAAEAVFDRLMIWDSLHFCILQDSPNLCGISPRFCDFMQLISSRFIKDMHTIITSLHKKCGLPVPAAARATTATPTKRVPVRKAPSSVVRRMARAAAAPSPGVRKPKSHTAFFASPSKFAAAPRTASAAAALKFAPPLHVLSHAAALARSSSASKAAAAAAGTPALGPAPATRTASLASLSMRVVAAPDEDRLRRAGATANALGTGKSAASAATRAAAAAAAAEKAKLVLERKRLSLLNETQTVVFASVDGSAQKADSQKDKNEALERAKVKAEQRRLKAELLMARRMSGGSGMISTTFNSANRSSSSLSTVSGALPAAAIKEKLKKELKRTERLRGPDLMLKSAASKLEPSSSQEETELSRSSMPRTPIKPRAATNTVAAFTTPKKHPPAGSDDAPKTPSSHRARARLARMALPLQASGCHHAAEMQEVDWDDVENSVTGVLRSPGVSDSPIKDVAARRPEVRLKVRSAKKRIAARMLDLDSLF